MRAGGEAKGASGVAGHRIQILLVDQGETLLRTAKRCRMSLPGSGTVWRARSQSVAVSDASARGNAERNKRPAVARAVEIRLSLLPGEGELQFRPVFPKRTRVSAKI